MQPAASDSLVGFTLIDKYKVVRPIGRGGMGEVYEATHVELGKRVAVKVMLGKYAEDSEAIARFKREALAASRIGNPHIIDVSDIGTTHDGRSFVVMEYLSGQPLSNVIELVGQMPAWRATHIMRQVLRAVHVAHSKGIIHRDLKPDNIFLVDQDDQHDFVKLLDFGISKMIDLDAEAANTKLTTTGVVMGTPLYMAPEQAMGAATDHRADIYACGVMLYEMLAGQPPFNGATYAVLVAKLLTADPQPLDELRGGLHPGLLAAVHRALQKEPEARFASAEAFAAALPNERPPSAVEMAETIDSGAQIVVKAPTKAPFTAPPKPRVAPAPAKRKSRWPVVAAVLALALGGTIGLVLALDGKSTTAPTAPATAPKPTGPTEATGLMKVRSTPSGATVLVDGETKGVTPLDLVLAPGKHVIHIQLDGFASFESEDDLPANGHSSITANLQRIEPTKPVLAEPGKPPTKPPGVTKPVTKPPTEPAHVDPLPHDTAPAKPLVPLGPQPPPPHKDPPPHQDPPTDVRKPNPFQ